MVVLAVGIIFKKNHWAGANVLLTVGSLALVIFFIINIFLGIKSLSASIEKSIAVSGGISMCVSSIAFAFKVQHWPGASILIIVSLIGLSITSILLIIDSIKETEPAKQSQVTLFAFTLATITAILIMMTKFSS